MKHQHIYHKIFEGIEEEENMFQHLSETDLGKTETFVVRYECECGDTQEFHHAPFEAPNMPMIIVIEPIGGVKEYDPSKIN